MDMIAPLYKLGAFEVETYYVMGFLVGFFFGVALERAGFGNARKLTAQFYFHDMAVFKVMFTAVVVAMVGLFFTRAIGLLDFDLLFVPPTYLWPQIVGGLLLGIGFVVGGYCPGTSVVGLASGKLDAMVYLGGFFFGLAVFALGFDAIEGWYSSGALGRILLSDLLGVPPLVLALLFVVAALGSFYGATWVERWARRKWSREEVTSG